MRPRRVRRILRVDASARVVKSVTREAGDAFFEELLSSTPEKDATIVVRDLALSPPPLLDQRVVQAFDVPRSKQDEAEREVLAVSDQLIQEFEDSDLIVFTVPVYNYSIPGALKAWLDLIVRAGVTFRYSEEGPIGLLHEKHAIVLIASGGMQIDGPLDHATPYLRSILGLIGIDQVTVLNANEWAQDPAMRNRTFQQVLGEIL